MIPRLLILAPPGQFAAGDPFDKIFRARGEYIEDIPQLYALLKEREVELILISNRLPGTNAAVLRKIRMRSPHAEIHLLTSDITDIADHNLVYDGIINLADGHHNLGLRLDKIFHIRESLQAFGLVGHSEKIKLTAETIERIAPTEVPVLIVGPSGTGKELVARAIHDNSGRADKKFVAINCGALAEGVLESELFGHEKGAFTGSVGKREGLFKQADGGTIFLDEIGETRPDIQVKLLRVLEDGIFYPVGGDSPSRTEARVIAATNRDLVEAIGEGAFREDLYFRLSVVKMALPALYERRGDIIPLLYHFAAGENLKGFSERAIELLCRYDWPGNIRQLRNFIDRIAALRPGEEVGVGEVEQFITEQGLGRKNLPVATGRTREEAGQELIYHALMQLGGEVRQLRELILANLPESAEVAGNSLPREVVIPPGGGSMQVMEKDLIESILKQTGGNRRETARKLGIGERTLYRKLKKYDLN